MEREFDKSKLNCTIASCPQRSPIRTKYGSNRSDSGIAMLFPCDWSRKLELPSLTQLIRCDIKPSVIWSIHFPARSR